MAALQPEDDLTPRDTCVSVYRNMAGLAQKVIERLQGEPAEMGKLREAKDLLHPFERSPMLEAPGTHLDEVIKIDAIDDDLNIISSSHQARDRTPPVEHASLSSTVENPLSCCNPCLVRSTLAVGPTDGTASQTRGKELIIHGLRYGLPSL